MQCVRKLDRLLFHFLSPINLANVLNSYIPLVSRLPRGIKNLSSVEDNERIIGQEVLSEDDGRISAGDLCPRTLRLTSEGHSRLLSARYQRFLAAVCELENEMLNEESS